MDDDGNFYLRSWSFICGFKSFLNCAKRRDSGTASETMSLEKAGREKAQKAQRKEGLALAGTFTGCVTTDSPFLLLCLLCLFVCERGGSVVRFVGRPNGIFPAGQQ